MPPPDHRQRLQLEVEALQLAKEALEFQLTDSARQADAMLAQLERQQSELREAHQREQSLFSFAERVMDTVGGVVIALDPQGLVRRTNRHGQDDLVPLALGSSVDALLHPHDLARLLADLPRLPWTVHSVLFETLRRQGNYRAEHLLAMRDGTYRFHLIEAALLYTTQGKEDGAVLSGTDISTLKQREQDLRASHARFNQAESLAAVGSWEHDGAADALSGSAEAARLLGHPEGLSGTLDTLVESLHPDDRPHAVQALERARTTGQPCDLEVRTPPNEQRPSLWLHLRANAQLSPQGAYLRSVGTVQDVTARKHAEERLRLAASVFDNSHNAVLIADAQGTIRQVNRAFSAITGYLPEDVIGQKPSLMKSGQHPPRFYREMWGALRDQSRWEGEVINRHKDGRVVSIWESISAVRDSVGDVSYYIGIFSDITEQKAQAQRIHQLAYYDVLTGLPNRALLMDRCEQAVSRARRSQRRLAVMFLDLDRFKHINDSLGHPVGDALLKAVAERLRSTLRETDTVARLGGDEFVVLLDGVEQPEGVRTAARRVIELFQEPFVLEDHSLSISTTVGVSLYPDHAKDVTSLFKYADQALYQAKAAGRGDFRFFESRLDTAAQHRLTLENELRHAIERNQLTLHYQPLFTLPDLQPAGAEALLRWNHPELGPVSPAQFIPIAEDSGLIVPIGRWVLETACRQARQWLDEGHALDFMAVNVAGLQIQRGDLVSTTAEVLRRTGLPPDRLELEISESYVMRHAERDLLQLNGLRELGVSLAIDDFGTGQTSLGQLWRLPLSKLKIDRAFMVDIHSDTASATVTRSIIGLGHNLGFIIVAEGVETAEHEDFLVTHSCDIVQGFRYAKPLPPEEFVKRCWPNAVTAQAALTAE